MNAARTAILVAALVVATVPDAPAADKPAEGGGGVYKKVLRSTVWLVNLEPAGGGRMRINSGTGTLIDAQKRLVLTNYHVVGDKATILTLFPDFEKGNLVSEREHYFTLIKKEKAIEGKVIARDPAKDLALVQLPAKAALPASTPALKLAAESVGPGDTVHSIGNPGASGALWAYTRGDVKAVYHKRFRTGGPNGEAAFEVDARVVETTSPVNPGDSGGPVVNGAGDLVAVTQGMLNEQAGRSISYFIDLSEIRGVLKRAKFDQLSTSAAPAVVASDTGDKPAAPAADDPEAVEKKAANKLKLTKNLARNAPDAYREGLKELIEQYPKTRAAQEARDILKALK